MAGKHRKEICFVHIFESLHHFQNRYWFHSKIAQFMKTKTYCQEELIIWKSKYLLHNKMVNCLKLKKLRKLEYSKDTLHQQATMRQIFKNGKTGKMMFQASLPTTVIMILLCVTQTCLMINRVLKIQEIMWKIYLQKQEVEE